MQYNDNPLSLDKKLNWLKNFDIGKEQLSHEYFKDYGMDIAYYLTCPIYNILHINFFHWHNHIYDKELHWDIRLPKW